MVSQFRGKAANYIKTGSHSDLIIPGQEKAFMQKVINGWRAFEMAHERMLVPTPYFFEGLHYAEKAKKLQAASLAGKRVPKVKDPLMEAIPIYNTVERRYAGFSNVPEQLWYGKDAPKLHANIDRGLVLSTDKPWKTSVSTFHHLDSIKALEQWLYITLAHRITGSGASFEADHGFRNSRIIEMSEQGSLVKMAKFISKYPDPIFTSIGNQIPPFNKATGSWASGGRQYLAETAVELSIMIARILVKHSKSFGKAAKIKDTVNTILRAHSALGCKQFKFVLTAWVMDMAEYLPHLVDPNSDCFHGKNAIESMNICFDRLPTMQLQDFYDTATRLFADVTGTKPMDVEDASPGCDLVRWIENYVPKNGFQHVIDQGIFNGSSLRWHAGRQPT